MINIIFKNITMIITFKHNLVTLFLIIKSLLK
jgi:hypothetical protein